MGFLEFLRMNYIWLLVVLILLIITIIGFFADRRDKKKKKEVNEQKQPVANVPLEDPTVVAMQSGTANDMPKIVTEPVVNNVNSSNGVSQVNEQVTAVNNTVAPVMPQENQQMNVSNSIPYSNAVNNMGGLSTTSPVSVTGLNNVNNQQMAPAMPVVEPVNEVPVAPVVEQSSVLNDVPVNVENNMETVNTWEVPQEPVVPVVENVVEPVAEVPVTPVVAEEVVINGVPVNMENNMETVNTWEVPQEPVVPVVENVVEPVAEVPVTPVVEQSVVMNEVPVNMENNMETVNTWEVPQEPVVPVVENVVEPDALVQNEANIPYMPFMQNNTTLANADPMAIHKPIEPEIQEAISSFNKVESENSNIENNNYSVLEEPVDEVNNNESSPKIVMEKAEDALKVDDDIWKL